MIVPTSATMRTVNYLRFSALPWRCTTGLLLHGVIEGGREQKDCVAEMASTEDDGVRLLHFKVARGEKTMGPPPWRAGLGGHRSSPGLGQRAPGYPKSRPN